MKSNPILFLFPFYDVIFGTTLKLQKLLAYLPKDKRPKIEEVWLFRID